MERLWFNANLAEVLEAREDFSLVRMHSPPGDQPPLHVHEADEVFIVLEGELCLWAGEEQHVLRPGRFVNAPAGVPHTDRVTEPSRYLIFLTPRLDSLIARLRSLPVGADPRPTLAEFDTVLAE